jgi:hypothetical protein
MSSQHSLSVGLTIERKLVGESLGLGIEEALLDVSILRALRYSTTAIP